MPPAAPLPQELIRCKREGGALDSAQIQAFVQGLTDGSWADSQVAAMAMAVLLRGMDTAETVALTRAMTHSGQVLQWPLADLPGPLLDKHSTGGVGDKVSLMLAPMLAACGAVVPMISGRGLGHTGGTLDKLEALPGYTVEQPQAHLLQVLKSAGCAIVGADASLAPADKRLYAIRDLTATVESVPLITASILSKKLAAGLQGLVLDVKVGSGAFCATLAQAQTLAAGLVEVAQGAGLPARALITDMNQVLGHHAGNALEVREAIDFLTGVEQEPRLLHITLALGAELLQLGGMAITQDAARQSLLQALASGAAAERFARMVSLLGGPPDVLRDASLPVAQVQRPVPALRAGFVGTMNLRSVGQIVVALGGGRRSPGQQLDLSVGLSQVVPLGARIQAGQSLAVVHAASTDAADAAILTLQQAITIDDAPAAVTAPSVWSGAGVARGCTAL